MKAPRPDHISATECLLCKSTNLGLKDFKLRNNYNLGYCNDCHFKFTQPRPSSGFLANYYNSISSVRFYKFERERTIADTAYIAGIIKKHASHAKAVLEIGASTGYYLDGLKHRGYKVVGSELSGEACKLAEEWYGLEMYADEFPPDKYENQFDVVIIYHVIEHVLDPAAFFAKASSFLRKDGILMVETPNCRSIAMRIFGRHYPVFCPPGHLNYFSTQSLQQALPNEMKAADARTTSASGQTVYNMLNATLSFMNLKNRINKSINTTEVVEETNQEIKVSNSKKYRYLTIMHKISGVIQVILFPLFWLFDTVGLGENLSLTAKKH